MMRIEYKWEIAFLLFIAIGISYLDRVNISHSILQISDEFCLSSIEQGYIMSSFSIGYVFFMLFGGIMVDKFGTKYILGISIFLLSICTMSIGLVQSFVGFVFLRFLVGMFEAPIFPSSAKIVTSLFSKNERGIATAFFDSGSYVGAAFAGPIIVYSIMLYGWRFSYLVCGSIGIIWLFFWLNHTRSIKKIEINFKLSIKVFLSMVKSRQIIGMSVGFFCYNYLKSFFLTWFPTYLITEKGYTFLKVGIISFIPPLCAIIGELISGYLTDRMISKGVNITYARKIPLCIGMVLSSVILLTFYVESVFAVIFIVSISYTFLISASPSIWAIPGDLSPNANFVGTISGIQNSFSNIAGILAPIVTGYLIHKYNSFFVPIMISCLLTIVGSLSYWFIVGELKPLKFNSLKIT